MSRGFFVEAPRFVVEVAESRKREKSRKHKRKKKKCDSSLNVRSAQKKAVSPFAQSGWGRNRTIFASPVGELDIGYGGCWAFDWSFEWIESIVMFALIC